MNQKKIIAYNLTNGIEGIKKWNHLFENNPPVFVRIQSSQCEAKNWMKILEGLDNNFLMYLALGFKVFIVDGSQRKDIPRAIYQGLPWIKFALTKRWFNKIDTPIVKKANVIDYFSHEYDKIFLFNQDSRKTDLKKRLDYFKPFLISDKIELSGLSFSTENDGDKIFYKQELVKHFYG